MGFHGNTFCNRLQGVFVNFLKKTNKFYHFLREPFRFSGLFYHFMTILAVWQFFRPWAAAGSLLS